MDHQAQQNRASLEVENIGGIDHSEISFSPGVTILAGKNATNRSSLLQGLMAALGSDNVSIKGEYEEAHVELTIEGETYSRQLYRRNGGIQSEGNSYLDKPTTAELFAFLLESNEVRRAIRQGQNLRELIMRPVDTDEIQDEIDRLVQQRRQLEDEIEEIESHKGKLPNLEEQRTSLRQEIEQKRTELEIKESELEDKDVEETQEEKKKLEEKLTALRGKRSTLEDIRYDIDTERETIESLKSECNELKSEQAGLPEAQLEELNEIESQIERLRKKKQTLEAESSELYSIITFNEEMLEDGASDIRDVLQQEEGENLTEQLLNDGTTTCWTCGSEVEQEQIGQTIEWLRQLNQDKSREISATEESIEDLIDRREELKGIHRKREKVEVRLTELENEIEESQTELEQLQERRDELTEEIANLEEEVEELRNQSHSEILDIHREANQLEYELGRLENDLEDVEGEIERIESRLDAQQGIEDELKTVSEKLESLRTKIERLEAQAIENFNEHMDAVLNILDYDNLDRIWLERKEHESREGRRKVKKTKFELHIIRSTSSNQAYEDTIDHLSESEREVVGLIFALTGYLVHEVYERIPFMVLDSVEAIDTDRLSLLVEYLNEYAEYLVIALLTEDAAALDSDYTRITEI